MNRFLMQDLGRKVSNFGEKKMSRTIITSLLFCMLMAACSAREVQRQTSTSRSLPTNLPTITEPIPTQTPVTFASATPPADTSQPKLLAILNENSGPVYSLAWSPDGRVFASAGYGEVKIWDPDVQKSLITLKSHNNFVWSVAWSPDGKTLASASQDGTVRLWETKNYTTSMLLKPGWAFSVAWSPDSKQLAVGTQSAKIEIYTISDEQPQQTLAGTDTAISLALSPDGGILAAGYWNGDLTLWDTATWKVSSNITGYTRARCDVNGLAWSPDGQLLASAHQDGIVRIWNPETGELARGLTLDSGWGRGVAWSPDGHWLAAGGETGRIYVWEWGTGKEKIRLTDSASPVWSVAWSRDGSRLIAGNGLEDVRNQGQIFGWAVSTALSVAPGSNSTP